MHSARTLCVVMGLALAGCGGGGGGGGGGSGGDAGGGTGGGTSGGTGGGTGTFGFASSGQLAVEAEPLATAVPAADFAAYADPSLGVPNVKATVTAATPGALAVTSFTEDVAALPDCDTPGSWTNAAEAFYCRLLKIGGETVNAMIDDLSGRTAMATVEARCTHEAPTVVTLSEQNVAFVQKLQCWTPFQEGGGLAFGKDGDQIHVRTTGGQAATIVKDAQGGVASLEAWLRNVNGNRLVHLKTTGTSRVEITAAGELNSKINCGVQAIMDKASDKLRIRAVFDTTPQNDCTSGASVVDFCTDLADETLTDDDAGQCADLEFALPLLYHTYTGGDLPTPKHQVTPGTLAQFGASTDGVLDDLMPYRIPSPLKSIKDVFYGTASTSIKGTLTQLDERLATIKARLAEAPRKCLFDVPALVDVKAPLDLKLPLRVSCGDDGDEAPESNWAAIGQANGRVHAVEANANGTGSFVSYDQDQLVDAWLVRGWKDQPTTRSLLRLRADLAAKTVAMTGVGNGSELDCGFDLAATDALLYARGAFFKAACDGGADPEAKTLTLCYDTKTFAARPLDTCRDAGLDVTALAPLRAGALDHTRYAELLAAKPTGLTPLKEALDQSKAPPLAELPLPADGSGPVDVVPIRSYNKSIQRSPSGGINYGRNCKHTKPVGRNQLDTVAKLELKALKAEELTALKSAAAAGTAFVSFNFAEKTSTVGTSPPALTRNAAVSVKLVDAAGAVVAEKAFDDAALKESGYAVYGILKGQSVDEAKSIVLTATGTAEITCAEQSGQRHVAVSVNDVKLRF